MKTPPVQKAALAHDLHQHIPEVPTETVKDPWPSHCEQDRFLNKLYALGIIDDEGMIIPEKISNVFLPILNSSDAQLRLKTLIHEPVKVQIGHHTIETTLSELCLFLKNNAEQVYGISLDKVFIVGSTAPWIMGVEYFKKAFIALGVDNVDELISPEIEASLMRRPEDHDFRIEFKEISEEQLANLSNSLIGYFAQKISSDSNEYSTVKNHGLSKRFPVKSELGDHFFINSFEARSQENHQSSVELVLVKHLVNLYLFVHDAIRLSVLQLMENSSCSFATLIGDVERGWASLPLIAAGVVNFNGNPKKSNKFAWPLLMSLYTRGKVCLQAKEKMDALFDCIQDVKELPKLLSVVRLSHHLHDPYAIFAILFNTLSHLPSHVSDDQKKQIIDKTYQFFLDCYIPNPENLPALHQIGIILKESDLPFEIVSAILELCSLMQPNSKAVLRKHHKKPTLQLFIDKRNTLLLPFDPNRAFQSVLDYFHKHPDSLYAYQLLDILTPTTDRTTLALPNNLKPGLNSQSLFVKKLSFFLLSQSHMDRESSLLLIKAFYDLEDESVKAQMKVFFPELMTSYASNDLRHHAAWITALAESKDPDHHKIAIELYKASLQDKTLPQQQPLIRPLFRCIIQYDFRLAHQIFLQNPDSFTNGEEQLQLLKALLKIQPASLEALTEFLGGLNGTARSISANAAAVRQAYTVYLKALVPTVRSPEQISCFNKLFFFGLDHNILLPTSTETEQLAEQFSLVAFKVTRLNPRLFIDLWIKIIGYGIWKEKTPHPILTKISR